MKKLFLALLLAPGLALAQAPGSINIDFSGSDMKCKGEHE